MQLKAFKKSFLYGLFYNISIKNKLIIFFLFIVFLPTSIVLIPVYHKSTSIISEKINISLEKNLNTINESIMQKFEEINEISTYIYLTPEVIHYISPDRKTETVDIISEISALEKTLETYYLSDVKKSNLIPRLYIYNRPEYSLYNFSNKVFDLSQIDSEKWYLNLPTKSRYSIVGLSSTKAATGDINTIKFAKRLYALKRQDVPYMALLTIDMDVKEFNKILNYYKPTAKSSIFILNDESSIQLSPDYSLLGRDLSNEKYIHTIIKQAGTTGSFNAKVDNEDVLISYNRINQLNWTIVSVSPVNELYGELILFKRIFYFVSMVCMVLSILFALLLSENIAYPIRKLVKSMSSVQSGNFDITLEYKRNDEFSYLISTYKKMVGEIKELIHKLYISEVNKKEAELVALQAQINPHFLYNTLDSINWMALKHNAPDISTMVTSLSDFFRYGLSKGKNIISLGDEIKQVGSYLCIQKIRFRDKLDYSISFPPEFAGYLTVKLILQPIVENAIIHGIERRRGKGTINISAEKKGDFLELSISDDGITADIDEINLILRDKSNTSKSFGIRNVNERIKQTFGSQYGLEFYANSPSGVLAIIRIPALNTMEGYHVENDYSR